MRCKMKQLLTAKHWQVFIFMMLSGAIGNIRIEGDPTFSALMPMIGALLYTVYPLSIGYLMQSYLPRKIVLNHNLFLFNVVIWIIVYAAVMILTDGQGMVFSGLAAIPILYVFYAILHTFSFPARTLKSIELGKKASVSEYIGDVFLMIFLPVGIWFLQPRINKIIAANADIED